MTLTTQPQQRERQDVSSDESRLIGRVASPEGAEATSEAFTFWVPDDVLVEKTQLIYVDSSYNGRQIRVYGIVDEVFRQSRRRSVAEERDRHDGRLDVRLPLDSMGITYARAKVLAANPPLLTPPREESPVYLATEAEARFAYGVPQMGQPLTIGRLKNGGEAFAGSAYIDLDYLLGTNGGHLNVNGIAGVGTKSSFLTFVVYSLLEYVRRQAAAPSGTADQLRVVPIILNVKNYDLMWLDHRNRYFRQEHEDDWAALYVEAHPFRDVHFFAPQRRGSTEPVPIGRDGIRPYSWSLIDLVTEGLFPYLFSDEDREDDNFAALVQDVEGLLLEERAAEDGRVGRRFRSDAPAHSYQGLLAWVQGQAGARDGERVLRGHAWGTWQKLLRRLRKVLQDGPGILRDDEHSHPLPVPSDTRAPTVIDINGISESSLQRFVVAVLFKQLLDARTGPDAQPDLVYVVVLDELNRFAPRGATDAITRLIERVVAEMRSQGIILLGAQQQASLVSPKVIENCAIRVLGRSGALELEQPVWSFLSPGTRRRAETLGPSEKLIYEVDFREPMHVCIPFPAWAMRRDEAAREE